MKKNLIKITALLLTGLFIFTNISTASSDISIKLDEEEITQGGVISLTISREEAVGAEVFFNDQSIKTYSAGNKLECLIPVSYWTIPGNYLLQLESDGNILAERSITVLEGNFPASHISVSEEKEEIIRPQNEEIIRRKEKDNELLAQATASSSQDKLWQGEFIWPVDGTITTDFGATRYVNGKLQSRHSGIDISAPTGTPVKAANQGYIKLAANLLVTGNTVIIDHGRDVYSTYSHLDDINVRSGEKVNKGQKIGALGSTGFSTGPHLHWVIKIGGIYINPREFLKSN